MSNAVLLEGFVHQNAEEGENSSSDMLWKGHWRFMKDKKGILQFNYTVNSSVKVSLCWI
jgi:hypothetical protein